MSHQKMSLEDLLRGQAKTAFHATVEVVQDKPELVKVTPWTAGGGCLCHLSMNLSKALIEGVTLTGDNHICCGKTLKVVELHFKQDGAMQLEDLFEQLGASANKAASSTEPGHAEPLYGPGQSPKGDPPPWGWGWPPWWHYPPVQTHNRLPYANPNTLCDSNYNRCMSHCTYSPNREECQCLCRSSRSICKHQPPEYC